MKKTHLYSMTAGLAITLGLAAAHGASAQAIDNNFDRGRSVAVNDRAKTDYQPLGLRLGAFMAQPSVGVSLISNDNIFYGTTAKKSDVILQVTPGVEVASDWSRNALAFGISSAVDQYGSATTENNTSWNAHIDGRYDISSHADIFGALSHDDSAESRGDPLADSRALKPVKRQYDTSNIGVTLVGNRLRLKVQTGADKEAYSNVAASGGGTIDPFHIRDLTTYYGNARVDYAVSPDVSFFVYAEMNRRHYLTNSLNNSKGSVLSVGTSFDLSKLARGELEVGTLTQTYKYLPSTGKLSSTYLNGKVEWFPTELTTVTFNVGTNYTDAPSAGAPTALATTNGVTIDHELLRNLVLSAGLSGDKYAFKGIDRTDTRNRMTVAANYFLSRRISLNVSYNHDELKSRGAAAMTRPYTDNNVLVGLVLRY